MKKGLGDYIADVVNGLISSAKAGNKTAQFTIAGLIIIPILMIISSNETSPKLTNQEPIVTPTPTAETSPTATITPETNPSSALKSEPIETPKPVVKTNREKFADTIVSSTSGLFAQEANSIIAPNLYDVRSDLWTAINGTSINFAEEMISGELKKIEYEKGLGWDDEQIQKMSSGIVKGLYRWNSENPGDL